MRRKDKAGIQQEAKYRTLLKSVLFGEKTGRTLLILCILSILTFLICPNLISIRYPGEGEISSGLIKAPYDFACEDKILTELKRKEVASKVNPVYVLDLQVIPTTLQKVKGLFEKIKKIREDKTLNLEKGISKFKEEIPHIKISDENLNALISYSRLYEIEEEVMALVKTWLSYGTTDISKERLLAEINKGIRVIISAPTGKSEKLVETPTNLFFLEELPRTCDLYHTAFLSDKLREVPLREVAFEIAKNLVVPNLRFDKKETSKAIKEAVKDVSPVLIKVSKGEKIVGEGEKVDKYAAMKLSELTRHSSTTNITRSFGFALILYVIMILVFIYLYKYQTKLVVKNKNLALVGLIIITAIGLAKIISVTNLPLYLIPMGAFAILLAVLLNEGIAIFVTVLLSILTGVLIGERMEFVLLFISGGLAAIYTTTQSRIRGDLIRCGIAVGIAQGIIIIGYSLFRQDNFLLLQTNLLWGSLTNGVMTTIIAMGGLLYLERIFNITTNFTLFELSDLNAPLLKNLLLKAPGTYHHSLLVGNIGESAAEAVGANSLLTRVSAYYHDIGKMIRPEYFIENQSESERSRHETLRSTLSVSILRSHIKDGVEIAKRNRLPQAIIEIIQQHHGESVMAFFYQQAKEKAKGNETNETIEPSKAEFSYPGPKPQTKEAAIIMLADSVEAASRTLVKPTPTRIEKLVKKIIDDDFITGELDECDLTLKDLNKIAQSFTKILITLFHARVEYPEKEQERTIFQDADDSDIATRQASIKQEETQNQPAQTNN
ncbi:MAG: HDIG domain-containing protein [bacterium]|nr:HDIG domain-containing protein [bacterium]